MTVDFEVINLNIKKNTYPLIGSGSGRRVYDLMNGYVVKVAKNRRGLAQNQAEQRIAAVDHSGLFAKVLAVSEDSIYLVMEKAEKVNRISDVWSYFNVKNNRELAGLKEFKDLYIKYDLLFADFYRPINWGMVKGRPVIIDYGFTREVKRKYYSWF